MQGPLTMSRRGWYPIRHQAGGAVWNMTRGVASFMGEMRWTPV